ncbi:MAG: SusD/RagB family nutrient-binding outer membrane lipoprotein [Bacteroidota bacterium]
MKNKTINIILILSFIFVSSCKDLTEINTNPVGVYEVTSDFYLSTVLTDAANVYHNGVYSDYSILGLMQYLQKDWHGGSESNFDWEPMGWSEYYSILRTNKKLYEQAVNNEEEFYQGVSLIMKSFLFGFITDLWGDAPYSEALQGNDELFYPKYDDQEDIYTGLLADLETANTLLSKNTDEYILGSPAYDVIYNGNPSKWRKLANSLLLRYYMRLSEKLPGVAQEGVEKILTNPTEYPVFESNADNAFVAYIGSESWDSWSGGELYDATGDEFRRRKPCRTMVDTLNSLNDPRLEIWIKPVDIQIVVEQEPYTNNEPDITIDDKRFLHDTVSILQGGNYDTSKYVGLPPNMPDARTYNLETTLTDGYNSHISSLTDMYRADAHELVKANLITYAEVCFIKAEAAQKGWGAGGGASEFYNQGVSAALSQYGVGSGEADNYLTRERVQFDNSLERIIEQKWLSLWMSPESWFDYRRTGFPVIQLGDGALFSELPLRFIYSDDEQLNNAENWNLAVDKLEETQYSMQKDHHYSKMWLLQGTGKPY